LCAPYYVAGKEYYAMLLVCRNSSNTGQNLLRSGKCALNFIEDDLESFQEAVLLGFPGETSEEKMINFTSELESGQACEDGTERPLIVSKAFQVFECTWMSDLENAYEDSDKYGQTDGIAPPYRSFNGITSKFGAHFILKIDKILMKDKFYNSIINGVSETGFPSVPVDYGYRDSINFWYTKFSTPIPVKVPDSKELPLSSVKFAAQRIDDKVKFTDDACRMMTKVPRVFLKASLQMCVNWARENNVTLIDAEHVKIINDKRKDEKARR
jgi:hypothetical protein